MEALRSGSRRHLSVKEAHGVDERKAALATELHKAVREKDYDAIEAILKENTEVIDVIDDNGHTPLIVACIEGESGLVKELLSYGADKDFRTQTLRTPLMFACMHGEINCAQHLIDGGCDIQAIDKGGVPVFHHAVDSKQPLLLDMLVKAGCDPNGRDHTKGWTPLMRCANTFGDVAVARALVHYGADVNLTDDNGATPLLMATNNSHTHLMRFLLSAGADKTTATRHGTTAEQIAMSSRDKSMIDIVSHPPPRNQHAEGEGEGEDGQNT